MSPTFLGSSFRILSRITESGIACAKKPAKMAEKWPCFGGSWQSWELAWTMNWVDRLRTSADKRMWSGRRAVVMRTGRRAEILGVKLGYPRSRCRAVVSDVFCVRSYVHFVCVCEYMCMCVCVQTWYMYIYGCVYVFVNLCVYTRVYVYVYAYLCVDCGLGISTSACGRCHACAYVFVFWYACVYTFV